jgi:hypothetical protein
MNDPRLSRLAEILIDRSWWRHVHSSSELPHLRQSGPGAGPLTGVFPNSPEMPLTCGPLELVACQVRDAKQHCGLVQLRQTYQLDEMYGQNYGYRSGLNRAMVSHQQEIV